MRHEFVVAGALIESATGLLLVKNQRRQGRVDWSTPGGVIDPGDASITEGLAREVLEETNLVVTRWEGPVYDVLTCAPDMGWVMRCEVYRAVEFCGDLRVDDPDGIVVAAEFVPLDRCDGWLAECHPWVREPLAEWLALRWGAADRRGYSFEVRGADTASARVVRLT